MNQYKVWQVALIYSVLIFGIIYALPNFFPTKPAIQIAFGDSLKANNTNIISDLSSELKNKNVKSALPEIMIPLVSTELEIKLMKDLVINIASEIQKKNKVKIEFMVGTMIELPRAAIKAKEIAKHAEFFSFGTNDLTQTTFGISRDDSGKFLNDYIENKIFDIDPFISIDDGVGDLIKIATDKGRKQNKKIKLGICGEHGGDPKSIDFCAKTGLDYVSCSPYRVPVARLAAAQAQIKKN